MTGSRFRAFRGAPSVGAAMRGGPRVRQANHSNPMISMMFRRTRDILRQIIAIRRQHPTLPLGSHGMTAFHQIGHRGISAFDPLRTSSAAIHVIWCGSSES